MNFARKPFSKSDMGSVNKMLKIMQVIFIVYGENALIAVRASWNVLTLHLKCLSKQNLSHS